MKKRYLVIAIIIIICISTLVYCSTNPFKEADFRGVEGKIREANYVNAYCKGQVEYRLPDKTRVDCLTDEYAIEFDWAKKWAESIGQSLYYAEMTGKKPAVAIIVKSPSDEKYIKRIEAVGKGITIFKIKAEDYKD